MRARPPLQLLSESKSADVRRRRFDLDRAGRQIPGILWTPAGDPGPHRLVLLGHGASGNKSQDYVESMARRLVRHKGLAAAAIDGPVHGDRRRDDSGPDSSEVFLHFAQVWSSDDTMTDEMVQDYQATVDALQGLEDIGVGPVGWWGLSMGTILGLPFVAADTRIAAAVLGCMGMTGPTRERIETDASKIGCPVLFLLQWDDELFARDTAFALFDALASRDKRLHASLGGHGSVPAEEFAASEEFLASRLLDRGRPR
ncbi:MAG: dienelactone hydrolase family protein [Acidimicrobiales bacterium]